MSTADAHRHRGSRPRRPVRLLRWHWWGVGTVAVTTCPLCGALVVAHGAEQHERAHAAAGLNGAGDVVGR